MDEVIGALRAVTERQSRGLEQVSRFLQHLDQIGTRDVAEDLSRLVRLTHVAPNDAIIRLADTSDWFARAEMLDVANFE